MHPDFSFFTLRFDCMAREALQFPRGNAANMLRGALGTVCDPDIFSPQDRNSGPAGLADRPRSFVFRARHLNGCVVEPGQPFSFDLHCFSHDEAVLSHFSSAFHEVAAHGIGPRRAQVHLEQVLRSGPVTINLSPAPECGRVELEFLSPTELKHEGGLAERPEFPFLFARIRDRISTLRAIYGAGPLEIDFRGMGERAAEIRMTRCEIHRQEVRRHSTRTGRSHALGGFLGVAAYEGALREFLPYLEAAQWTGVGRQAVWGKGEIRVTANPLGQV